MRINLIGAGRLGQTLGRLLSAQHQIGEVLTRSQASAQAAVDFIGQGQAVSQWQALRDADLWLLAVPDAHLSATAQRLGELSQLRPALVCHGSGAQSSAVLASLQAQGWQTASAHCLLSFAQPALAVTQFAGVLCALEGQSKAVALLRGLFEGLGAQCVDLATADKLKYHTAAVWATNFLPVLQDTAEQLWREVGLPESLVLHLREQLLGLAVRNVCRLGPQAALTGPAARGDTDLVAAETALLHAQDLAQAQAYQALSVLAARLAQRTAAPDGLLRAQP